jgi:hypothetical protein
MNGTQTQQSRTYCTPLEKTLFFRLTGDRVLTILRHDSFWVDQLSPVYCILSLGLEWCGGGGRDKKKDPIINGKKIKADKRATYCTIPAQTQAELA